MGDLMSKRCKYTNSEVSLLGRLIRSEAVGEGNFGMMLVGNVVVNRVVARCFEFKNKKTISKVINAKNAFDGIKQPLFKKGATAKERELALKTIKFWRASPATSALWYYYPGKKKGCKSKFWGNFCGKYKNHCFYQPPSIKSCGL